MTTLYDANGRPIIMPPELQQIAEDHNIHFYYGNTGFYDRNLHRAALGMDAQSVMNTPVNGGVPWYLTNLIDPTVIGQLVTAMKGAKIYGEVQKGNWTTASVQFPVAEMTGEVVSYGDRSEGGSSDANVSWVDRQSFHFQTTTTWGEQELARWGLMGVDRAQQLNNASILATDKYRNKTYFNGVAGLKNYGTLNDPALLPAVNALPTGASNSVLFSAKDGAAIYGDFQYWFKRLVAQSGGLVESDMAMTIVMSPTLHTELTKTNTFNVNVFDQLKKNFPNTKIETAPELSTVSGEVVQWFVDSYEGIDTVYCAFTEKLRTHAVVTGLSSWKQKKSAGTWGAIVARPLLFLTAIGM